MSKAVLAEAVEKEFPQLYPSPSSRRHSKERLTIRRAHKWLGITSALWLAVLGATGFFLDHRDWRWMWQTSVSDFMFPESILEKKSAREMLFYRINNKKSSERIAGGKRGLWHSENSGSTWNSSEFDGLDGTAPQVFSVIESSSGFEKLLVATDDGVWQSTDGGISFHSFALRGQYVSALTQGSHPNELLGVISKSSIFKLNSVSGAIENIKIDSIDEKELPTKIGLSRFVHDLHFGRGIVNGITSLLINDAGGIAMVILPVTGILFWLLPRRWKKKTAHNKSEHLAQRSIMRFLYGWHGVYIGTLTSIIVIYLSITGIIIGHRAELADWMKTIKLERSWLPPVYDMRSWEDEIYSIAGYPGAENKISLGLRTGLYTTEDGGKVWNRENLPGPPSCFIWSLRRVGEFLFTGGMGCPNAHKQDNGTWLPTKGIGHMPTDAFMLPEGGFAWKSPKGLMTASAPDNLAVKMNEKEPEVAGTPLFYLLDGLHSGLIFHSQWKWINDLVSVIAIFLCVSGLYRLWHGRRVVFRRFLGIGKIRGERNEYS